jgi:hypothetical protein
MDGRKFKRLALHMEPSPSGDPILTLWSQLCKKRLIGGWPRSTADEILNLYGVDGIAVLKKVKSSIISREPLNSRNILSVLLVSDTSTNGSVDGTLSFICEKLLLRFEVQKRLEIVDSPTRANALTLAALACLFLNTFEQDRDWRFFNTALKINDKLYSLFTRPCLLHNWRETNKLTSILTCRAFTIQERVFSEMEMV